ncbi:hypothetical protein [Chitinophaga cymbidii]|uniref:Uncharacterized protein n=1 Tax=Chitinophaga cymbidii TaxID=1096750 RepID=A0A512RJ28_9BACT|nr:hypothetical protein [Chitinophaga cymbidii]GEP95709.1 hypothetical protein CCY01nite_19690 [Chitinophaga cymbidii]
MAKQTGLFIFTGKLDNVIGYERNGQHFIRSMPARVRQTTATRQASMQFGAASRKGKLIRKACCGLLDTPYDGSLVNRLNKALIKARRHHPNALMHFQFNRYAGTGKFLQKAPVLRGDTLHIPPQEFPALGGISHLQVSIIAVRINFAERRITGSGKITKMINLDGSFTGEEIIMHVPGRGTLLMILQVQGYAVKHHRLTPSGDRRLIAADIVAIVPPVRKKAVAERKTFRKDYQLIIPSVIKSVPIDIEVFEILRE